MRRQTVQALTVAAIAIVALLFLGGCSAASRYQLPDGCEVVKVDGPTDYLVAYRKADGWYLSAPGEESVRIDPPRILTMEEASLLGVIAFRDARGHAQCRAFDWSEHGPPRRFCLID